jgi:NTP pyrophosphatase (non-canonical NTP hydrolase)
MTQQNDKDLISKVAASGLQEVLQEVYELRQALSSDDKSAAVQLNNNREKLEQLLDYLVNNMHNPEIDAALIRMLADMLGVSLEDTHLGESIFSNTDEQIKTPEEKRLEKEQHDQLVRFLIYEIYKMMNPKQIAGETRLDNFINNAILYGVKAAIQHENKHFVQSTLSEKDLHALDKIDGHSFVQDIQRGIDSIRQGGRGI